MGHTQTGTSTRSSPYHEDSSAILPVRLRHNIAGHPNRPLNAYTVTNLSGGHHAAGSWQGLRSYRQEPASTYSQSPGTNPPTLHLPREQGSQRMRESGYAISDESGLHRQR